ncbi:MAG: ABC transporter ATP-binding protein [Acidobacteriota bacterium]
MTAAHTEPIVRLRGLVVAYGDHRAVDRVDLDIRRQAVTAILGPSGCGKTSLLRAIAGFESPRTGAIELDGEVIATVDGELPPEKRRVSMMFQEGALFPHRTVEGNVLYGLAGGESARRRAQEALELVGMAEYSKRYPDELSGGQQQRVALARALAPSPRLVLLDEPFANLDAALRMQVREEVRAILETAGATAILVTHDQDEALSMADVVVVMEHGRVLQAGTPEEVYHRPASPAVARFVGDGQFFECAVADGWAESLFGRVRTDAPDGPGHLLVRPEDLEARAADIRGDSTGTVLRRRFFGHDLLDEIRLDATGETLWVRGFSRSDYRPGSRVSLTLRNGALRNGFDEAASQGGARVFPLSS